MPTVTVAPEAGAVEEPFCGICLSGNGRTEAMTVLQRAVNDVNKHYKPSNNGKVKGF
jgi:phage terminase large subunit-like protein